MLRRNWLGPLAIGAMIALPLTMCQLIRPEAPARTGPRTLKQLAHVADRLGLHYRSDIASGKVNLRLVVSDYPLTFDRANSLRVGDPHHPCWRGTVSCCTGARWYAYQCDGEHAAVWGDLFLYGDPTLIRQLMSIPVPDEPEEFEDSATPMR